MRRKQRRRLAVGLAFLAPNILGFLVFTLVPLALSLALAFTNWDLKLHNMFKDEQIRFVGLDNFTQLFREHNFWRFLGNTLFLMMAMPITVAASLISAMLLSKDLRAGGGRTLMMLLAGAGMIAGVAILSAIGAGMSGMTLMLTGLSCGILIIGVAGGSTAYRTLFYVPHFTAGVATYLLWKKLYNPQTGPVNNVLVGPLSVVARLVNAAPSGVMVAAAWICFGLAALLVLWGLERIRRSYRDGDLGPAATFIPCLLLLVPAMLGCVRWQAGSTWFANPVALLSVAVTVGIARLVTRLFRGQDFPSTRHEGAGTGLLMACALMVAQLILLGLGAVCHALPAKAAQGLAPPDWLADVHWAKPAIMIMGFWAAVGSQNMLLYLAALTNVPGELYEAADIDGASRFQKFWNITWPQLAPTTFFIVVMGVIGGLQGGFEMARVMTNGGPAGATTTLAFFIYTEGFQTGRLGYSSAVAWTLFLMVMLITLFNWRFGNRYVND